MILKHQISIAIVWAAATTVELGIAATNYVLNFPLEQTLGFICVCTAIAVIYTVGVIQYIDEMKKRFGAWKEHEL